MYLWVRFVEFGLLLTVFVGRVCLFGELITDLLFSVSTLLFRAADFVAVTLFLLLEPGLLTPELELLRRVEWSVASRVTLFSFALLFRATVLGAIDVEVLLVPSFPRKTLVPVDLLFPY